MASLPFRSARIGTVLRCAAAPPARRTAAGHAVAGALVVALIGLAYLVVHATGGTQYAYVHLGYLPILVAAAVFGIPGSIVAAVLTGVALGPLMPLDVATEAAQPLVNWTTRSGFFVLIGTGAAVAVGVARSEAETARHAAMTDPRTGLPNHAALHGRLEEVSRGATGCCLVLEIGGYDRLQLAFGPAHADAWAKSVAALLEAACPAEFPLHQVRAHRFCVWLRGHEVDAAVSLGIDLGDAVAPSAIGGLDLDVDLICGIAPTFARDGQLVFSAAAAAIEMAKASKSAYAVCDEAALALRRADVALVDDFRGALRGGDDRGLELHLQPKVDLRTGRCRGAEALLRWNHPRLGPVPPGRLFGLIDRTRLMGVATRWVLARALELLARVEAGHDFVVAVNVSVHDLEDPDFAAMVIDRLDAAALSGARLEIEVTETAFLTNRDQVVANLTRLRARGVAVAIDDFGTGHASFDYLKSLPIDTIKIDRGFVAGLPSRLDAAIVRSAILLATELGCDVVAEGIETEEVRSLLVDWGCRYGQGYLFSAPVPIDGLNAYLGAGPARPVLPARRSPRADSPGGA